ncbi:glycoside hydrolase, partial [Clostridium perfringens]
MQYQTLEGFGVNLAWWGNTIGKWPEDKRNEIADLLFSEDGLGINVLRFNIGGGDDPGHNHMNSGSFVNAEMEGYQPSPGVWNWDGDAGEREMLRLAKERGVNIFEAFANSAPYWMTKSGC